MDVIWKEKKIDFWPAINAYFQNRNMSSINRKKKHIQKIVCMSTLLRGASGSGADPYLQKAEC